MNKTVLILKNELLTTLRRPGFLVMAFAAPVIGFLVMTVASYLGQNADAGNMVREMFTAPKQTNAEGYVDHSGILRMLPDDVPAESLIAYPDEAAARAALGSGAIDGFYIIPADYLQTGKLISTRLDFNPMGGAVQSYRFRWALRVNLLNGDTDLAEKIAQPIKVEEVALAPELARDQQNPLSFIVPYAVTMLYYTIIFATASLLLSSIAKEKENRIIEVLMVSATPRQLLLGKIIGLGIAGLVQTILWVGSGYVLLRVSGQTFSLPAIFQLPPSFLVWGLVFFVLGYAVYGGLMAGIGALVPNLRESSQATIILVIPLLVPLMFITILIEEPHSTFSLVMSLFPLTAPVVMMTRLAAGGVPWWQPVTACALLLVTAYFIIIAVARMFHAQTILSGQPFNIKRYLLALVGRG